MAKDPFVYQKADEEQSKAIVAVMSSAQMMAALITTVTYASRESDIALQKLEEVAMWANKSIAFNGARNVGGEPMGQDFGTPTGISPGLNAMQKDGED